MSQIQIRNLEAHRVVDEGVFEELERDASAAHEAGQHGMEGAASRALDLERAKSDQLDEKLASLYNTLHSNEDAARAEKAFSAVYVSSPVTKESLTRDLAGGGFWEGEHDLFCSYLTGQMSDLEYANRAGVADLIDHE